MKIAVYHGKNEGMRSLKILSDDLCSRIEGAYPVNNISGLKGADVILNLIIESVPKVEDARRFVGFGKQVCLFTGNVLDYKQEELVGLLYYCMKIPLVVHSYFHLEGVTETLKVYRPDVRKRILDNTTLNLCGVTEELISETINDKNKWIVPHNRGNKGQKNMDEHITISNKVFGAISMSKEELPTHKFYLLESENIEDLHSRFDLKNYVLEYCPSTREEYVQNCKEAGVFICTSNFESFGLMYIELLASGVVGIFLDKPWVRQLLPDYKLVASKEEMPSLVLSVMKDYKKASIYIHKKVIPDIQSKYTFDRFAKDITTTLETTYERSRKDK